MEVIYCLLLTYWISKEQLSMLARSFEVVSRVIVPGMGAFSPLNPTPLQSMLLSSRLYLSGYFVRSFHYLV